MRRRTRRTGPPTCNRCSAEVKFFRDHRGRWKLFNPRPVDGRTTPYGALPVWGNRAWDPDDLASEISVQRGSTPGDAGDEVLDLPWYQPHACGLAALTDDEGTS